MILYLSLQTHGVMMGLVELVVFGEADMRESEATRLALPFVA